MSTARMTPAVAPSVSAIPRSAALAADVDAGFDRFRFVHCALPELDLRQVDTSRDIFGRHLTAPMLLRGPAHAEAAQAFRLALTVPLSAGHVRAVAPDVLLLASIGAGKLERGVGIDECRRAIECAEADALLVELDALREVLRPDGDTDFSGLLPRIAALCRLAGVPVVVEDAGSGMDAGTIRALLDAGVAAVGVGGVARPDPHGAAATGWRARMAAAFAGWGTPMVDALLDARRAAPGRLVLAGGGARSGIDVAKAVAMGADLVDIDRPVASSTDAFAAVQELVETLRVAMFCVGASDLAHLRGTRRLVVTGAERQAVYSETLRFDTAAGEQRDITPDVAAIVARSGVVDGHVLVYSHHTTCAVRINENEPLLLNDFERLLSAVAPAGGYEHDDLTRRPDVPRDEPINGHSHCRHLLLSTSETIPVHDGRLVLGRWQSLLLFELCSARARELTVMVNGSRAAG